MTHSFSFFYPPFLLGAQTKEGWLMNISELFLRTHLKLRTSDQFDKIIGYKIYVNDIIKVVRFAYCYVYQTTQVQFLYYNLLSIYSINL